MSSMGRALPGGSRFSISRCCSGVFRMLEDRGVSVSRARRTPWAWAYWASCSRLSADRSQASSRGRLK